MMFSGVTDIGAGQASALAQIAIEVLGVTMDNVVVYNSDSAVTPLAGTTTATRAPSWANSNATSRPIPRPAPVMLAVLPSSFPAKANLP